MCIAAVCFEEVRVRCCFVLLLFDFDVTLKIPSIDILELWVMGLPKFWMLS